MFQKTKYKIAIYSLVAVILLALLAFWIYFAKAQERDYRRLADLKVWQDILSDYYFRTGTYRIPNCDPGRTLSQCLAKRVNGENINNINDPINSDTRRYVVISLSDDDYEVAFTLEAGIGGYGPGQYIWTKNGIKK